MVLMVAYLSWSLAVSFIVCKWIGCDWLTQNDVDNAYFPWFLAASFIVCKWIDCDWVTQNGANGCLFVLASCYLIHSM